jgi:signal peptidase I
MEMVARLADVLRLRPAPHVRASPSIETPQLTGVRRPTVLMPVERTLTSDDRAMALCHELLHIRRHDLVLGWVPALAERLFFFHPLVRLAAREYVTAREAACDVAVVRTLDVSPAVYARLLVRIGVAERRTVFAAGGASPSMSSLRRRLHMLQYVGETARPRGAIRSIAVVLFAAMMPFQLVAKGSSADRQRIPIAETQRDGGASTATSAQSTDRIPSAPLQRMPETVGTSTSSNRYHAPRVEPGHRAGLTQAGDAAALEQQVLEERLNQLEMMRKALDEQAQRQESFLRRQTITREMVEERKREYLAALEAFQEAQERMMRMRTLVQQLAQLTSEQQALKRRQQDNKGAAQSKTHSRGDVVWITAAPDGTRQPDSRVLAIPGDRILVARAGITVNGAPVTELSRDFLAGLPEETWEQVVPPDHYFVAAEQRADTGVTRFWGLIPAKRISGRR